MQAAIHSQKERGTEKKERKKERKKASNERKKERKKERTEQGQSLWNPNYRVTHTSSYMSPTRNSHNKVKRDQQNANHLHDVICEMPVEERRDEKNRTRKEHVIHMRKTWEMIH